MVANSYESLITDPFQFKNLLWPDLRFYRKQEQIIESVVCNDETVVPAGNDLGKDFISAFLALWFFCSRSPAIVIATSSGQSQLKSVLWGEIGRFISTARYPLPLNVNDLWLRQLDRNGQIVQGKCYLKGMVTVSPENLQGHHLPWGPNGLPRTFGILDEASGIDTPYYDAITTWAHRILIVGNPLPCNNFFFMNVELGDVKDKETDHHLRKIIHICGEDSPNVQRGIEQKKQGKTPDHKEIVPGVLSYREYLKRRELWNPMKQCIGVDGKFYKGASVALFPDEWLSAAMTYYGTLPWGRQAKAIGVDNGEGSANTTLTAVDEYGIIEQKSEKTPDTTNIEDWVIDWIKRFRISSDKVFLDRGGGGYEIACSLRRKGYKVQTVAFGGSVTAPIRSGIATVSSRRAFEEEKYAYKNKRAEMYGLLRNLLDPRMNPAGFAIPPECGELRRQLRLLPLRYDNESRMWLPPKKKKPGSTEECLIDIIGCSPDEADSCVLAVYGMNKRAIRQTVGIVA